jgi:biopolymer transport protein ExbB/TolQ
MWFKRSTVQNFATPLWSSTCLGALIATAFYSLIAIGPLNNAWLIRYAQGHPVSIATVYLFCIAGTVLTRKIWLSFNERYRTQSANSSLLDLMQSMPEGEPLDSVRWLDSMWKAQPAATQRSYFGARFGKLLRRLIQRGSTEQFDQDLQELADEDANSQHDGYSLVRIVCWAMPMLGFLGTVVGISQTLGSMDMQRLSSGDDSAMKSLTAGLYIAFDTTAIGLVLTIVAMFGQFVASGKELGLLSTIDGLIADRSFAFLKPTKQEQIDYTDTVQSLAKLVMDSTSNAIQQLLEQQQASWLAVMEKADRKWEELNKSSGAELAIALKTSLDQSLTSLAHEVQKVQNSSITALDLRYQQWQTTLSDQARSSAKHQDELNRQSELLGQLVANCENFNNVDQTLQATLGRMTDVDRFHEAAICLTEAVAVLGIQLERSGQIGKIVRETPRKKFGPQIFRQDANDADDTRKVA